MYTLADKSQLQARAIDLGAYKLPVAQLELMEWFATQFGVCALDFYCERRVAAKGSSQQLIHVVLGTVGDVKKMQASRSDKAVITERFLKYFKTAHVYTPDFDPSKSDVFPVGTDPFPEIIVTYRPLKELDRKIVNEILNDEKCAMLKTFESVWTMSMSVIFFYTSEQIKENQVNGTSAKIIEKLDQIRLKYGFEPSSYSFDSKEIFDRDYESKWHYYWK